MVEKFISPRTEGAKVSENLSKKSVESRTISVACVSKAKWLKMVVITFALGLSR